MGAEREKASAAGKVVCNKPRREAGIWRKAQAGAGIRIGRRWVGVWTPVGIQAHRIERGVRQPQVEVFRQEPVAKLQSAFDLVPTTRIREVGAGADVVQAPPLTDSSGRVPEGVATGKKLKPIKPVIGIEGQKQTRAKQVSVTRGNVRRADLRPFILAGSLLVECDRLLKPGALRGKIQVECVTFVGPEVDMIEDRFTISFVV